MTSRQVRKAAKVLVAAVASRTASWYALNPQVQWAIDDELAAVTGRSERGELAHIKNMMTDCSPDYWQRFWCKGRRGRYAEIRRAMGVR